MGYKNDDHGKYVVAEADNAGEMFEGLDAAGIGSAQIIKVADDMKTVVYVKLSNDTGG